MADKAGTAVKVFLARHLVASVLAASRYEVRGVAKDRKTGLFGLYVPDAKPYDEVKQCNSQHLYLIM